MPPSVPSSQPAPAPLQPSPSPSEAQQTLADYALLQARVDAFFAAVLARHPTALHCQAGCYGCCQAGLSVSAIEAAAIRGYLRALPPAAQDRLRDQVQRRAGHTKAASQSTRDEPCALLDDEGRCAIYPVRPLVCRSQGLPLVYAATLIPAQALRFRAQDGRAVVCCPLNFAADSARDSAAPAVTPQAADLLDAERVDLLLAVLNRRFASQMGQDPTHAAQRTPLAALVLAASDPDATMAPTGD